MRILDIITGRKPSGGTSPSVAGSRAPFLDGESWSGSISPPGSTRSWDDASTISYQGSMSPRYVPTAPTQWRTPITGGTTRDNNTLPRNKCDWSLPPTFLCLLTAPLAQTLNTLIPLIPARKPQTPTVEKVICAPFITALLNTANTRTDNGAMAHSTTRSELVDLFFEFTPGVLPARLYELLTKAWAVDSDSTLKIIFHARSIYEGKGFEDGFFRAMAWVWDNHPRTLLDNLHLIVDPTCIRHRSAQRDAAKASIDFKGVKTLDQHGNVEKDPQYPLRPHGSFHDLVDILLLHLGGQFTSKYHGLLNAHQETLAPRVHNRQFHDARLSLKARKGGKRDRKGFKKVGKAVKEATAACHALGRPTQDEELWVKLWMCGTKADKHRILHERLNKALTTDKKFQALYLTIVNIFVVQIRADLSRLNDHIIYQRNASSPHLFGISYAAKWIPTAAHGADKQLHLASAFAFVLFSGVNVNDGRKILQGKVLSPLRAALSVPEVGMVNGNWNINYTKVPSRCMSRNAVLFMAHDPKGYEDYLTKVATGRYTISGASLLPHEILLDAISTSQPVVARLANLQWKSLVDSIASSSKSQFSNCLAVADVSGSMGGLSCDKDKPHPLAICVALTLLLGELSSKPWKGCFLTFSSTPAIRFIETSKNLTERARTLKTADWGMSTAFGKTSDLILETAKRERLPLKDMVKKLFVFSDMQFNQASAGQYGETEYQTAKRKFEAAGYKLPEMVYWNLAAGFGGKGEQSKPATMDQAGVSLVSGWSGSLFKYFLGQQEENENDGYEDKEWETSLDGLKIGEGKKGKNPLETVMEVIGTESFRGVRVVD